MDTYTVTSADVGKTLKVRVSFTDTLLWDEMAASVATATVVAATTDTTAPTVSITKIDDAAPVSGAFTVVFGFDEPVSGFALDDITVTNARVGDFLVDSTTLASAVVTPNAGATGVIKVTVAAGAVTDGATNANANANAETSRDFPIASLSIADASASESAGSIDFSVTLGAVHTENVTVSYRTADGTGSNAADGLHARRRGGKRGKRGQEVHGGALPGRRVPPADHPGPGSGRGHAHRARRGGRGEGRSIEHQCRRPRDVRAGARCADASERAADGALRGPAGGARRDERVRVRAALQRGTREPQLRDAARPGVRGHRRHGARRLAQGRQPALDDPGRARLAGRRGDHAAGRPGLRRDRGHLHGGRPAAVEQSVGDGGGTAAGAVDGELQRCAGRA